MNILKELKNKKSKKIRVSFFISEEIKKAFQKRATRAKLPESQIIEKLMEKFNEGEL